MTNLVVLMKWRYKHPEQYKQQKIRYRLKHRRGSWARATLSRHRHKGYITEITSSELTEIARRTEHCYYCGCEFDWDPKHGKCLPNSPSMDRIDNDQIIRKTNIRIICHSCNTTKLDRTHEEFVEYCKTVTLLNGIM